MVLTRELIEKEIVGSEAALKAHEEGVEIHKVVLKMFREELAKLPEKKKE